MTSYRRSSQEKLAYIRGFKMSKYTDSFSSKLTIKDMLKKTNVKRAKKRAKALAKKARGNG